MVHYVSNYTECALKFYQMDITQSLLYYREMEPKGKRKSEVKELVKNKLYEQFQDKIIGKRI